ncbi:ScpA family protein [Streptomyces sp. TP-A0356]|uniref:segregation and condensation protein A n=1 Tax=Streptomyces sp. TP-A0356 TaxID=1359208 RepID=UPI0006E329AF|nr:segregation/condensation protein A [Streptomyces sp. TP-A0356]
MTSYESGSAGRRRVLGRGPGAPRVEPPGSPAEAAPAPTAPESPSPVGEGSSPAAGHSPVLPGGATAPRAGAADEAPPAVAPAAGPAPEPATEEPAFEPGAPLRDEPEPATAPGRAPVVGPATSAEAAEPGPANRVGGVDHRPEPGAPVADRPVAEVPVPEVPVPEVRVAEARVAEVPGAPEPQPEPAAVESDGDVPGDGVFKVRLANFEGPFDLLLQLISRHKLDVTEVALSKVTDEFMAHIRAMGPDWDLDQTTEFLVVAATLLDLKAARLLPAAEVEDEADLALLEARDLLFARLLQYRAYKQIAEIFNRRTEEEARRYPRTVGLEPHHAELLPEVVISIGPEGFARLAVKAMQPKPKPQVYVDHIHAPLVSVQEQAQIVVERLRKLGEASFRELVEDTGDTLTLVARFLALLELYREKAVALEQEAALGELTVRWTGGDGDGTPRVTDEFDRPPEDPDDNARKTEEKA